MLYVILTLVLVISGGFAFLPRFSKVIERHNVGVNYVLTLLATLVGVLVAISISNYHAQQAEKADMIKLLSAAEETVDASFDYSQGLLDYIATIEEQAQIQKAYINNPPPTLAYLDAILVLPIVSKNISSNSLSTIVNLNIVAKQLSKTSDRLAGYVATLSTLKGVLELEIDYQKGLLTIEQLSEDSRKAMTDLHLTLNGEVGASTKAPQK